MPNIKFSDDTCIKILGLLWDSIEDVFKFIIQSKHFYKRITKCAKLSTISIIFDPHGLIGSKSKILIQKLWTLKIDRVGSVPLNIYTEWTTLQKENLILNNLKIPWHI